MDTLQEVLGAERAREPRTPRGWEHVARAGHVVPDAGRGPRAAEDGAGCLYQRDERVGVGGYQFQVLRGHHVADVHRLGGTVDEDRPPALGERRGHLLAAWRLGHEPLDRLLDGFAQPLLTS